MVKARILAAGSSRRRLAARPVEMDNEEGTRDAIEIEAEEDTQEIVEIGAVPLGKELEEGNDDTEDKVERVSGVVVRNIGGNIGGNCCRPLKGPMRAPRSSHGNAASCGVRSSSEPDGPMAPRRKRTHWDLFPRKRLRPTLR